MTTASHPAPAEEAVARPKARAAQDKSRFSGPLFWGFISPALILTLLFTMYPLAVSVQLIFQRWAGFGTPRPIGTKNITDLFSDPQAFDALVRTFWLTLGAAGGTVLIGTALALAFYRKVPLTNTLKFLAFLPVILPPTVFALAWKNALDPTLGWINPILRGINPDLAINWLSDPKAALPVVIFVSTIQYVGIPMILMLSALNDIPESVNEAATLDGVSGLQRIWHVTLPLSRDVLVVVIGLQIIGNFKALDTAYALTKGGPGLASDIMATFIYREGFELSNFGYASTAAFFGTLIIVIISLAYTFVFRPSKMSQQ
ncbi:MULTISPECIES: carbohydrate ABC transporter permease [unclassified Arthrobacter]|uniref:carbohydrate ABC transporter permease n=1 Tax=unclassified Arthrobacter TaxID=235627 RepID=UPI00366BE0C7